MVPGYTSRPQAGLLGLSATPGERKIPKSAYGAERPGHRLPKQLPQDCAPFPCPVFEHQILTFLKTYLPQLLLPSYQSRFMGCMDELMNSWVEAWEKLD